MDIDSDLDLNLLQQFSCLGTTDRDVLICQLQKVLGYQLNTTECATDWPPACSLKFVGGDHLGHMNRVSVESLRPGHTADVSVEMTSPGKPGVYQGQWRMSTMGGQVFGEVIWAILTVAEGGLLAVTQQMEAFHQLGSPTHNSTASPCLTATANPFASPKGDILLLPDSRCLATGHCASGHL
ncbi:hypothetical protein HPB48_005015 [Haemaphysalis longicornis]|uniref:Nbr1 FW domain-containing protein n=1 Tax=Haemaphysalis longicornis TaxID=44386 RepID=A0A9J6G4E4_HAELO|nr:hypothetical protein HPB48_005015 [Haemaphysalis longicornis]